MRRYILAVTILHPFVSRNILQTDVLSHIIADKSVEVILIVPTLKKEYFSQTYASARVRIVDVDANRLAARPVLKLFFSLAHLLMDYHYLWYKRIERLRARNTIGAHIKFIGEKIFVFMFANRTWSRRLFRRLYRIYARDESVQDLLTRISPDAVFCTDVFNEADALIANEAHARQIQVIAMVRSWDNCYSKGVMRVVPDRLIVNTHKTRDEAIRMHDVPSSSITVCGLPQYDHFVGYAATPKEDFFHNLGADPHKKLILFSPAGAILSSVDWQVAEIILDAIDAGRIDIPAQLLIRNHPHHPADMSRVSGRASLVFDNPGVVVSNRKEAELPLSEKRHLADVLYYADVVIYIATTLGNDSLIFDKPQIVVDFDGYESHPYTSSVRRYHNEDHMRDMLACGGTAIAASAEELINIINTYLSHPERDVDGRRRALQQEVVFTDGHSGERVGAAVLRFLQRR